MAERSVGKSRIGPEIGKGISNKINKFSHIIQ